jgi:hypothetical protein
MILRWVRLVGCLSCVTASAPAQAPAVAAEGGWTLVAPTVARRTGVTADPHLREASGAATSRKNPGVIWTIEDSGNPPALIAMDTLGRYLGQFTVLDAVNVDWEEVALGPCGPETCVYIADTGDNDERRDDVAIYRFVEPALDNPPPWSSTTGGAVHATRLRFRYPDGAHDIEAMSVLPDGAILLVSKGRSAGVRSYRLDQTAWSSTSAVVAASLDSLPIVPSAATGRLITGMALAPDGHRVMLRTYRELLPFTVDSSGHLTASPARRACNILGLEPQGEGVSWLSGDTLVLTSERGLFPAGSVWIVECRA